jgi:hypothetical protein
MPPSATAGLRRGDDGALRLGVGLVQEHEPQGRCAMAAAPALGTSGSQLPGGRTARASTRYPHGLGKLRAHDHTRSGTNPVTNFRRSTVLYNLAISHNSRLDADHDRVACEAH